MTRLSDQFDYLDLDDFEELLADKPRDEKWELIGGRVVKMVVGPRWEHHFIVRNLDYHISDQLRRRGSACRVFAETFRVKKQALKSSVLPDIIVRCGPMEPEATSLDDPTVLIEVVSDGSWDRDKVEKRRIYHKLASLQHYVMVERDTALVEVFDRISDVGFTNRLLEGLDALLELPALDLSIPIAEIYRDVLTPPA